MAGEIGDSIEQVRAQLLGRCDLLFAPLKQRLEALNADCVRFVEAFEECSTRMEKLLAELNAFNEAADLLDDLAEHITEEVERLDEETGKLDELADAFVEDAEEAFDNAIDEAADAIGIHLEATTEHIGSTSAAAIEKGMAVVEAVSTAFQTQLADPVTQILDIDLPSHLGEQGQDLLAGFKEVKERGLSKIEKLTDLFDQVHDTSEQLVQLVETVKPVLDQVRQVL